MTEEHLSAGRAERVTRMSAGQTVFSVTSIAALLLAFLFSDVAIASMKEGMSVCLKVVVPALFPFMVLSDMLVVSGGARMLGKIAAKPLSFVLDVSGESATAMLLGLLCGFPIGSVSALSLYSRGRISRGELERLLCFCNLPSSAFLIGAVGEGILGSAGLGVMLYCSHIISALTVGIAARWIMSGRGEDRRARLECVTERRSYEGLSVSFTGAITRSADAIIGVCSFVIFFSAILGVIGHISSMLCLPPFARAMIGGFFEMTGGVALAAELPPPVSLAAVAAVTGWSGLSVHFQLIGLCKEQRVSLRPYFLGKAASAIICPCVFTLLVRLAGDRILSDTAYLPSFLSLGYSRPLTVLSLVLFVCGAVMLCFEVVKKKRG